MKHYWQRVGIDDLPESLRYDAIHCCLLRRVHPYDASFIYWKVFDRWEFAGITGDRSWNDYCAEKEAKEKEHAA